ncbi:rhodanese-like domain-containing protein [Shewanella canadensis]|uniref:Rhodanese-like domain-containing protein n=1 Tax=Shewanella canadensis TaxID=271096 RepID=A0A431WNF9_9GAMM|nr:rhodanese-like domain-containing protein [Shewanella canadensis]RTR36976.1 rhodanese-like domain-containing protein [Shewanella canadensis]
MLQSLLSKLAGAGPDKRSWELIEQGAKVIDVRTPEEFGSGHLPQAINVPLSQISTWLIDQDPKQSFVLYCAAGIRAQKACDQLKCSGFHNVINAGSLRDLLSYQAT